MPQEQSNWTGATEQAVREGEMKLSVYLQRFAEGVDAKLNLRLVFEQALLHEKAIADLDKENAELRKSMACLACGRGL